MEVSEITVADAPERERYEVTADGELAGFAVYRRRQGLIAFVHTEVDERFEGHGLASRLAERALADARAAGLAVLPFCPFFNGYIQRHPELVDLVPEQHRAEFGL